MDMRNFQYLPSALRLYSGPSSLDAIAKELDRLKCRRAVIVCGATLAREGSPLALVKAALGERCVGVLPAAKAHSPVPDMVAAAAELKRLEADAVIAVGGGTAVVAARAASIFLAEGNDVRSLCTTTLPGGELRSPRLAAPKLPQFVVPTTPTTATVKAGTAVFDPVARERLALFDPKTRAHAVFVHPELVLSAPRSLVLGAALNALTLAVEGLTSRSGNPFSDALLMHAVRLLVQRLADPALDTDAALRADLIHAAVMCGQGSDHTGAGMATVFGHNIGMRCGVENGTTNAIVLPPVLRFNGTASLAGLQKVATALGLDATEGEPLVSAVSGAMASLADTLGVPRRLRDVGVPREALPEIAAGALGDWFLRGNPRPVTSASDLQQVLEAAW